MGVMPDELARVRRVMIHQVAHYVREKNASCHMSDIDKAKNLGFAFNHLPVAL